MLNAETGTLLKKFATDAPVITDVGLVDADFDGYTDFAYAADVAGNLYRVSFAALASVNPENAVSSLAVDDREIVKIASTANNEMRFYNRQQWLRSRKYFHNHWYRRSGAPPGDKLSLC